MRLQTGPARAANNYGGRARANPQTTPMQESIQKLCSATTGRLHSDYTGAGMGLHRDYTDYPGGRAGANRPLTN